MGLTAGTVARTFPLLAVLACAGRVDLVPAGDAGVEAAGGDDADNAHDAAACPGENQVQSGAACDLATQGQCSVPYTYPGCDDTLLTTTCSCTSEAPGSAAWLCAIAPQPACSHPTPPPPELDASACPAPASIVANGACTAGPDLECPSAIPVYNCAHTSAVDEVCFCAGAQWSCGASLPTCADASSPPFVCPDPNSVEQAVSCTTPGAQCAGHPQSCDGAVFYDAFECDDGQWNDVAVTQCASNGSLDAGVGGVGDE